MAWPLAGQDDFGFGDDAAEDGGGFGFDGGSPGGLPAVSIGGEVAAAFTGFVYDFSDAAKVDWGDVFTGKLNFSASGGNAEAVINLKLAAVFDGSSPVAIDEAYVRGYFGGFDLEGGLRKLTWGKADVLGPLDVINPLDYSDFTNLSEVADMKLPRPLVHASYRFGSFTKLEGVFIPVFEGHLFDMTGRWKPAQMDLMDQFRQLLPPDTDLASLYPDTRSLKYAQTGLRFTTSIGPVDIGAQYFYGNLFQPAQKIDIGLLPNLPVTLDYNRYHQIGVDYAQVVAGFNLRAEAAANITGDLAGDDGAVYNPSLGWSLGFDRDLVWGINLNLEGLGSIRLLDDKVGAWPADVDGGTDVTATRLIISLTKNLLRDTLELRAAGIWEIEEKDFIIMPAISWTKGDIRLTLSGGIFGGDGEGFFGQYKDNTYIRAEMSYSF
ncbi:MAG: hypothetical protein LBQ38_13630 [Spirochaetaceae bacterium]|jgi:hypothetical protein|nr:hypothetical protein [Spirochaetaceae bacterium]